MLRYTKGSGSLTKNQPRKEGCEGRREREREKKKSECGEWDEDDAVESA